MTRERARAAAKALVAQGEARVGAVVPTSVQAQVTTLTEDLLATSKANRHLLVNLVRGEVERSVARLGLASAQELDAAVRRGKGLERRVAELEEELNRSTAARKAATTKARKATAKKATAKKTTAKKTTAKKTTAKKKTAAKPTAAPPHPAPGAAATGATATTTAGS